MFRRGFFATLLAPLFTRLGFSLPGDTALKSLSRALPEFSGMQIVVSDQVPKNEIWILYKSRWNTIKPSSGNPEN